jgi:ferredoxin
MVKLINNKSFLTHRFPKVVGIVTQILWLSSMIYAIIRFSYGHYLDSKDIYSYPEILILFCLYGISSFLLRTPFGKDELGHYLCPFTTFIKLGIKINIILKIPGYRIIVHKDKCKSCKKCNSICSYQNDVVKMVQQEVINYSVCSNCGKCIKACKFNALERQWTRVKDI